MCYNWEGQIPIKGTNISKSLLKKIFMPRPNKDLYEVKSVIHRQVLMNKVEKSGIESRRLNSTKTGDRDLPAFCFYVRAEVMGSRRNH